MHSRSTVITVSLDVVVKKVFIRVAVMKHYQMFEFVRFFFITLYNLLPALQESSFSQRKEISVPNRTNAASLLPDSHLPPHLNRLQLQYKVAIDYILKGCNR